MFKAASKQTAKLEAEKELDFTEQIEVLFVT
jgi:hypothetical protein